MTITPQVRLSVTELEPRDVPAADFRTLPILPTADPAVLDNARAITTLGHQLGRRPDVFMKFGDSNTLDPQYLYPFGDPAVVAGVAASHPELLDGLLTFQSPVVPGENSFTRTGTVRFGGYLPLLLPQVPGEIATTNASLALVMIGTNDLGIYGNPSVFRPHLELLVQTLTSQGVLPVLSTVPPDHAFGGVLQPVVLAFNQVIADVAEKYRLPLWNAWAALAALPNQGILEDQYALHLNHSPNGGGSLTPVDLAFGQNVRNLEALQILTWYRQLVLAAPTPDPALPWTPLPADRPVFAVGRGAGQAPVVEVRDAATGELLDRFTAYDPAFTGGVRVAVADVNGDGFLDVTTAAGAGGGPVVNVFDGKDGHLMTDFFAFDPGFRNGFTVAAGDLDGDGKAEIVVGAGNGGGPAVAVFHGGDLAEVQSFFAFDPAFRGGVSVAVGDFADGPGIVVGAGAGGPSAVEFFRAGSLAPSRVFTAFDASYTGGVNVAAGDLNGDGVADVAVSAVSLTPTVVLLDAATGAVVSSVLAGDPTFAAGASVAIVAGELLAASGPGADTAVVAFPGLTTQPTELFHDTGRAYGLDVG
jgi:hypothetical protein